MGACETVQPEKSIEIQDISWVYENIDTSYWSDGFNDATLFLKTGVVFKGSNVSAADFKEFKLTDTVSDRNWTIELEPDDIDFDDDGTGYISRRLYSTSTYYSGQGAVMPLGPFNYEVTLKNGKTFSKIFTAPEPGKTTNDGVVFVKNEDIYFKASSVDTVKRVTSSTGTKTGADMSITFSITDSLVSNGWIFFVDATGRSVGYSDQLIKADGTAGGFLGAAPIDKVGGTNTVTINTTQVNYYSGKSASDIAGYRVYLTDGDQYEDKTRYDCLSISRAFYF